jgi:glycerophosphoryl diester phosphodiesterase
MPAFARALAYEGIAGIETDLRLSKDGVVVLIHDAVRFVPARLLVLRLRSPHTHAHATHTITAHARMQRARTRTQTLNRTTNGTGDVVDFTVAELKQFSAGYPKVFGDKYPDYRIPTFREALELLLNSSNTIMVLDLKVEHLGQHIASDIAYVSMCVSCVACAACAACRVMSRVSC